MSASHVVARGVARIGVAQVEITPGWAGPTSGWGVPNPLTKATAPAESAEIPYVTAVALSDEDNNLVVLANLDIHGGSRPVWEGAAKVAGIDGRQLVLCGSHTHNGPGQPYGGLLFRGGSTSLFGLGKMRRHLVDRVGLAVKEAVANLAPGGVDIVRGTVDNVGTNRATPAWKHYAEDEIDRFLTEGPGRALADRERKSEKYRDPRMTVMVATNDNGQLGVLGWYGVHPNSLGPQWPSYSADLYGWARARVVEQVPGAMVGFGGGAAGDISPLTLDDDGHMIAPDRVALDVQGRGLASAHGERIGSVMADLIAEADPKTFSLAAAYQNWKPTESLPSPSYGMTQVGAGIDGPTDKWEELEAGVESERAKSLARRQFSMEGGQGPKLNWTYWMVRFPVPLGWFFRLTVAKTLPLHAVRIQDHVFVTVPGEPTAMAGWRIEQAALDSSAAAATASVIGYAGDYCGYWVTPEEYLEQRYEGSSTVYGRDATVELSKQLALLAAETDMRENSV